MCAERDLFINARLPEDLEEPSMRGIEIGGSAWTTPWAMEVDSQRRCWLKASFAGYDESDDTISMRVTRVEEGFVVDLSDVDDHKWSTTYAINSEEIDDQDPDNPEWFPVVQIIR